MTILVLSRKARIQYSTLLVALLISLRNVEFFLICMYMQSDLSSASLHVFDMIFQLLGKKIVF